MTSSIPIEELSGLERKLDISSAVRNLTDSYFRPKSFEKRGNGLVYRMLGVKYIQKFIMETVGKAFRLMSMDDEASSYFIGEKINLKSLKDYEFGTRVNEVIHAPFTVFFGYLLLNDLNDGNPTKLALDGLGLLINSSCTMLQRYNRARVQNVVQKRYQGRSPEVKG
ncbi:MAG: hypothetical protein NTW17_00170 [Candidatus Pacearchaeota archaeon]|nr:hypothetical protein [Candidatus Pacearchaeota archaeon]